MEMNVLQVSALVMGLGSILFLAAAFSPISRVFGERYAARRLEIIMASRSAWTVTQWLFAVGAAVTVVGVGIAALDFRLQPSIPLWTAACPQGPAGTRQHTACCRGSRTRPGRLARSLPDAAELFAASPGPESAL